MVRIERVDGGSGLAIRHYQRDGAKRVRWRAGGECAVFGADGTGQ